MIEQNATTSSAALIAAVLAWWAEHECDTISADAGDGYGEEYNVYDAPPPFVQIAQALAEPAQPVEAVDGFDVDALTAMAMREHERAREHCHQYVSSESNKIDRFAMKSVVEMVISEAALAHPCPNSPKIPDCSAADIVGYFCKDTGNFLSVASYNWEVEHVRPLAGYVAVVPKTAPTGEQDAEVDLAYYAKQIRGSVIRRLDSFHESNPSSWCGYLDDAMGAAEVIAESLEKAQPRPMGVPDGIDHVAIAEVVEEMLSDHPIATSTADAVDDWANRLTSALAGESHG